MAKRRVQLMGGAAVPGAKSRSEGPKPSQIIMPEPVDLKPEDVNFAEAPEIYASGCQVTLVGNDFVVMLTRPRMATADVNGEQITVGTMLPVAYVTLSVAAAKDLGTVLQDVIARYEKDMGPIDTPFQRARSTTSPK